MKETMCTYIDMLHHQMMAGRPVAEAQREHLAGLILEEPLNPKAYSRAICLGEPPESVKGLAALRILEQLPRKIGPNAAPGSNWLTPAGSADALHIKGYFHSAVNSLLTDAYRANEKFHGRPDPRTVKKISPRNDDAPSCKDDAETITRTMWSENQRPILPLEEMPSPAPNLEDVYCDTQYDHCFRALVSAGKDPLQVLYFLCRRLDFMPQEQLALFARRSPIQILDMVEQMLLPLDHLDRRWAAPLRSRLPEHWPSALTAKEISNGISRMNKVLAALDLTWYVAA